MNTERGFYYEVSQEQVDAHRKRSVKEILMWLHNTNLFLSKVQTQEEKNRMKEFRE